MYTYQDLLNTENKDNARMEFTRAAIGDHKGTEIYKNAILAKEYDRRRNRTIMEYKKYLYTASGKTVPDNYSANYKMCSDFFNFFVTQESQYLLDNGVTWQNDATSGKLGEDFNTKLQDAGRKAIAEGESFGFWNLDHLEVFGVSEFVPLRDEENGALMSGVRFWQIDNTKPLRGTLYELDGCTEFIWDDKGGRVYRAKRPYVRNYVATPADGTIYSDGENYPSFPIVPLWGSSAKQSFIVGLQEDIDAYDLIKSGFANDLDEAAQIYWILKNAGGMDEVDLAQFRRDLKRTKAVALEDGIEAEPHTQDVPYAAREALLTRLRDDLFEHAMAFDPKKVASGGSVVTAAIKAAYEPLDAKTNEFEVCVRQFLDNLLEVVGIDGENPSFKRSVLINQQEQISVLVSAGQYLPQEYITRKILTILGDGDQADEILAQMDEENMERMTALGAEETEPGADDNEDGESGEGEE